MASSKMGCLAFWLLIEFEWARRSNVGWKVEISEVGASSFHWIYWGVALAASIYYWSRLLPRGPLCTALLSPDARNLPLLALCRDALVPASALHCPL